MNRLRHIDGLRGLTMLLVVYHHICNMAFPLGQSQFDSFCLTFRMPLFFFISGFFIYKENYTLQLLKQRSKNRIIKQLYPTLVIGVIYCLICLPINPIQMLFDPLKGGYWFTFVAVEYYFLFALLFFSFKRLNIKKNHQLSVLLFIGVAGYFASILLSKFSYDSQPLCRLFNLYEFFYYILFVVGGVLLRIYYNSLEGKLNSLITPIVTCVLLATTFITLSPPFVTIIEMISFIMLAAFFGIISLLSSFSVLYSRTNFSKNLVSRQLELIGTSTLEIYLLHYFVIKAFTKLPCRSLLSQIQNTVWEFPIYIVFTIATVYICLLFTRILKSTPVSELIFPSLSKDVWGFKMLKA